VNTYKNPENDFHRIALKMTSFDSIRIGLIFFGYLLVPKIMKFFNADLLDKECTDFFEETIYENFRTREKFGIVRHDMINLMLEARKGRLAHNNNVEEKFVDGFATVEESNVGKNDVKRVWEDVDLAAQCLIFFAAGFDSVSKILKS
jgi:cytochrome P450 family 9